MKKIIISLILLTSLSGFSQQKHTLDSLSFNNDTVTSVVIIKKEKTKIIDLFLKPQKQINYFYINRNIFYYNPIIYKF